MLHESLDIQLSLIVHNGHVFKHFFLHDVAVRSHLCDQRPAVAEELPGEKPCCP